MEFSTFNYILVGTTTVILIVIMISTLQSRRLTIRQWGVALLSALSWGLGWFIGWMPFWGNWERSYGYFASTDPSILIGDIELGGYYSLALSPTLATLLGVAVLYLLLRYLPSKGKGL